MTGQLGDWLVHEWKNGTGVCKLVAPIKDGSRQVFKDDTNGTMMAAQGGG